MIRGCMFVLLVSVNLPKNVGVFEVVLLWCFLSPSQNLNRKEKKKRRNGKKKKKKKKKEQQKLTTSAIPTNEPPTINGTKFPSTKPPPKPCTNQTIANIKTNIAEPRRVVERYRSARRPTINDAYQKMEEKNMQCALDLA